MNDEQIAQATVGEPTIHNAPIELAPYDPEWPLKFELERARIADVLGDRALRIEHVGSTSVPGLSAKPIIDIVLVVADSTQEPEYVQALESAGYVLRIREPNWHEHRAFRNAEDDVKIHVFSEGCTEVERMLLFRDRLRANAHVRELYQREKQHLAQRTWKYVQNYADAKAEVIREILSRIES